MAGEHAGTKKAALKESLAKGLCSVCGNESRRRASSSCAGFFLFVTRVSEQPNPHKLVRCIELAPGDQMNYACKKSISILVETM